MTPIRNICLICDDPLSQSGVGTQAVNILKTTGHKYKYTVIGGALRHPHLHKIRDISYDLGLKQGQVEVFGTNGYGDILQVRGLIKARGCDAILLMTDPRFHMGTIWSHNLEFDIPIMYYWLWDAFPTPLYNRPFIQSCDWIGSISKQSDYIAKQLDPTKQPWQYDYIPHGVDPELFKNRPSDDVEVLKLKEDLFKGEEKEFTVLWVNRNARRKQPGQLLLGWKRFQDTLTPEQAKKTALVLHTEAVDPNGTDLPKVVHDLGVPNVYFNKRIDRKLMGSLNSMSDCIINVSSAEGFGLNVLEGIMSEKMIIATRTGGMKDQTNGPWAIQLEPRPYLAGSIETPYIYEDVVDMNDIASALKKVHDMPKAEREANGKLGREFAINAGMTVKRMGERFLEAFETVSNNFAPRSKKYQLYGGALGPRLKHQVAELEQSQHGTEQ